MVIWSRTKVEETGKTVRTEYTSRINTFFRDTGGPHRDIHPNDNPLDVLFQWAHHQSETRRSLQIDRDTQARQRQEAVKQAEALQKEVNSTAANLRQALNDSRNASLAHDREISQMAMKMSRDAASWEKEKEEKSRWWRTEMDRLKRDHTLKLQENDDMLSQILQHNKQKVDNLIATHKNEVDELVGQLLVNQDDNLGWTDEKLKRYFGKLKTSIESLASHRRKEFQPPDANLGIDLDVHGFVERVGKGKSHVWLKNKVWTVLIEQFFSAPLGFGALGPGRGKHELFKLSGTWQKLITGHSEATGTYILHHL